MASVVSLYIAVDSCSICLGTAARIAKTFNFGRMLPSAYEVPAMYEYGVYQANYIIPQVKQEYWAICRVLPSSRMTLIKLTGNFYIFHYMNYLNV